jgi:hypothetical protein
MNLRQYYQKIQEAEASLQDDFPVMSGKDTGNGGSSSVLTETTRAIAAKMLVEGTADLASPEQAAAFRQQQADALRLVQDAADAGRVQVAVVSADEIRKLRGASRPGKE